MWWKFLFPFCMANEFKANHTYHFNYEFHYILSTHSHIFVSHINRVEYILSRSMTHSLKLHTLHTCVPCVMHDLKTASKWWAAEIFSQLLFFFGGCCCWLQHINPPCKYFIHKISKFIHVLQLQLLCLVLWNRGMPKFILLFRWIDFYRHLIQVKFRHIILWSLCLLSKISSSSTTTTARRAETGKWNRGLMRHSTSIPYVCCVCMMCIYMWIFDSCAHNIKSFNAVLSA